MRLTTRRNPRTPLMLGLAAIALGVALGVISAYRSSDATPSTQKVVGVHVSSGFDVADTRKLVGFATDVFIGRVVHIVGTDSLPDTAPGGPETPVTRFAVEVEENIKGRAEGTVTVNQMGGRDSEGTLVLFESDPLLVPGQEYLFVTRRLTVGGSYQLVAPGYDNVLIESAGERSAVAETFREAYREETPFTPTLR